LFVFEFSSELHEHMSTIGIIHVFLIVYLLDVESWTIYMTGLVSTTNQYSTIVFSHDDVLKLLDIVQFNIRYILC
jgi:hypothetical protein